MKLVFTFQLAKYIPRIVLLGAAGLSLGCVVVHTEGPQPQAEPVPYVVTPAPGQVIDPGPGAPSAQLPAPVVVTPVPTSGASVPLAPLPPDVRPGDTVIEEHRSEPTIIVK